MSSTAWSWLLAIVGTLASVAGVVFSWLAWIEAGKAKNAAREAANAVRVRNLAHSVSRWAVDARDLLKFVRDMEFSSAQRAAITLLGDLSHNKGWQTGLKHEASAAEVEEVVRLLTLVNTYMTEKAVFEVRQTTLAEDCQVIYRRLSELAGTLDARAENL